MKTNKKSKNLIGIIQSFLILILVVLIIFMMIQISRLQGTARVINYAGLVRGATQREIKLEITGNQNDELIKYLDDILLGLRYQDGHYDLVKLNDEEYQEKLQIQSDYWDKLKTEIEAVRNKGYENTDIVNMSEIYFTMADETVSSAESYSEKIAVKIRTIELLSALDMLSLVILVIMQTLKAMQMAMQNRLLEQKAFVDAHTGLPNKNACNELLNKKDIITDSTACIMFDLNNLKTVNDTMGHSAGDQLILNFAKLLCSVIPEKDFVGRYGGDEFIAVIYYTSEAEIKEILKSLSREKERLNSCENQLPIDYACGWALSSDDMACTMQMLLDDADAYMYKNKQLYWRYNKCLYNTTLTDKEYNKLLKQLRKLYDTELLDVKDNAWEKMHKRLAKERKSYKKKEQTISTYVVQPAGSIEYTTINKRECATVITGTLTKAKQKRMQIYEKFLCRKDAKGKWRILGWEQTTDKEEIATLGDN